MIFPHLDNLVSIAKSRIGTHEEGGNNQGASVVEYQKATWLDPAPWPWCAAFVDWCIMQWQQQNPDLPYFERPQTAGAFDLVNWAKGQGLNILDGSDDTQAGDIVVYEFSHTGIVCAYTGDSDYFSAIEGNTHQGSTNASDSNQGDGVWQKTRNKSLVKNFIRFETA